MEGVHAWVSSLPQHAFGGLPQACVGCHILHWLAMENHAPRLSFAHTARLHSVWASLFRLSSAACRQGLRLVPGNSDTRTKCIRTDQLVTSPSHTCSAPSPAGSLYTVRASTAHARGIGSGQILSCLLLRCQAAGSSQSSCSSCKPHDAKRKHMTLLSQRRHGPASILVLGPIGPPTHIHRAPACLGRGGSVVAACRGGPNDQLGTPISFRASLASWDNAVKAPLTKTRSSCSCVRRCSRISPRPRSTSKAITSSYAAAPHIGPGRFRNGGPQRRVHSAHHPEPTKVRRTSAIASTPCRRATYRVEKSASYPSIFTSVLISPPYRLGAVLRSLSLSLYYIYTYICLYIYICIDKPFTPASAAGCLGALRVSRPCLRISTSKTAKP